MIKQKSKFCRSVFSLELLLSRFRRSAIALGLTLLCSIGASAQLTTSDILGSVSDTSGAVIPSASVTLTDLATHQQRSTSSNAAGEYAFTLLKPGQYTVTVHATGFKTATTLDVAVEAGDRARADAHLQPGSTGETVTVEAQTPLLQADNATVSSTVTERAVQDLPLNGRNFVQLVQLVPGANEGPGNGLTSGGRPDDRRQSAGFSVNGQDDTLNNYVIDGIDNNERIIGTIGVRPNVEGIQEITVETNSYAPEAGRTAGGVVNVVTKSGSDRFHGSAYEYFRNDIFDARNFFAKAAATPKAELRQNQYGGSVGGPVFKDKTFFFVDYEGFRLVSGTTYSSTVPTLAQYDDIHSLNGGTPAALVAQGNGTQNLPVDPIALNYLSLFPLPNAGGSGATANNYIANPNKIQNSNVFDVRIDHSLNPNNIIFARYTYNKVDTDTPAALPLAVNGLVPGLTAGGGKFNFSGPATDAAQQYTLNYTHIFNARLVTDVKAGYTRINNLSLPLNYGTNGDTLVGFGANMNFNQATSYLTPISINGFNDVGDGAFVPLQDIDNTFQYLGTVSYSLGNHNIKAGASLIRRQARNLQSAYGAGRYSFGLNSDVGATSADNQTYALASTLVGAFTYDKRSYDLATPDYRTWEPSFFVQDSWKVSPKLTLVYGLRYDVFTPFTEVHNRISNFDFDQALNATASTVASALKVAGVNGVSSTAGIATVYSDAAPRVGFAYNLLPTTVIRGGYGLSFFPGNYTSNADLKNAPFTSVFAPGCQSSLAVKIEIQQGAAPGIDCANVAGATTTFDQGLPLPAPQTITSSSLSFTSESPNLKPALIQQFNLQVEQQFGPNVLTIGYVGNIGQHLAETINDINVPKPTAPTSNAIRPLATLLPNLSTVSYLDSEGISNYNGLQISFQRRLSHGLAFDANYTWSHALSDVIGFSEEETQGWSNSDPTRIRQIEYGNSETDIRNRAALSLNYESSFGKEFTGLRKLALAGWQGNLIAVYQSGKPFSIENDAGGYGNRAIANFNGDADRPNQIHSATLSHPTLTQFFDTTAFVPQTLGTVGSEARNSLYGPHFRHFDLSLFKNFPLTEAFRLQFRAEAFNLSNTPSFYISNNSANNTALGSSSFGQVTDTDPGYSPRQFQFALKLLF